jgi:energy-coupling factor transporter ATP-binding protein EcfA2
VRLTAADISCTWRFRDGSTHALKHFAGTFQAGVPHIICGPTGSGKTTLALLLAGLRAPDSGTVTFDEMDVRQCRSDIAFVFQFPETLFFEDSVEAELRHITKDLKTESDLSVFDRLGLSYAELALRHPYHLSAGYGRLTATALQLARRPKVLFVDEPTIGLDDDFYARMTTTLCDWEWKDRLLIVITHDLDLMQKMSGQSWVVADGSLAWSGSTAQLLADSTRLERFGLGF